MTIRIEPHYRVEILPNVGAAEKDGGLWLFLEVKNTGDETVSALNIVAVAYLGDGTLCSVDESAAYLALRPGEVKALSLRIEAATESVDSVRIYAETEFDEDDPRQTDAGLEEPPCFMRRYFEQRAGRE